MVETCKNSCEYCDHVNRGTDEYCHETYNISDRCPLSYLLKQFIEVNGYFCGSVEWIVRYTGCNHFKEDLEYKQRNEDVDRFLEEMHEKYENQKPDPGTG
jgi:hypothetical protein